jgi:serine/threonine protein kinase/Tol biopolymer transport system component
MVGSSFSHYTILEKLGEGGMGIVYKARDTNLDRFVALKFLPPHLSASAEEKARFIQEAKAASALSHPNVCTIHDIQEHDGQMFIVMEFVDGQTLREKKSGMSLNRVVEIGIQIAEGLAAAHESGIIHRDIKGENIIVRNDGRAQIMDFGLAKLRGVSKLTKAGSTIGTMAYMSPEQVQGVETDNRTDIFSLGVVLYELLAGQLPFRGEHESALMYEIVNYNPAPIASIRKDVEPELERIVMKCLEKDRDDRYQSVKDVAIDLKHFRRDSSGKHLDRSTILPGDRSAPQRQTPVRSTWVKVALPLVVLLLGGIVTWKFLIPTAQFSRDMVFRPLQVPFSTLWYPGLSGDGNWVAFPATDEDNVTELYYMHVSGGEPRRLTSDSLYKLSADISPDGGRIVYAAGASRWPGSLGMVHLESYVISTLGGMSKKIFDGAAYRWSPDGKFIAGVRAVDSHSELWIMDADGNNQRKVFEDSVQGRWSLAWSPDGKSIAWLRNFAGASGTYQEIVIRGIESGSERQVTFDKKNIDDVCWMPQGEIIFSSNRGGASNLWAIPSNGGAPVQLTRGPGPDLGIRASRDGKRVLYLQQAAFGSIQIGDLNGLNGRSVTPEDQNIYSVAFAPDGRSIAFIVADQDPLRLLSYLYTVDASGRNRRQLTTAEQLIMSYAWSPDGRSIAFSFFDASEPVLSSNTMRIGILDVANTVQRILPGNGRVIGWTKGGDSLNVVRGETSWRVPIDGGMPEQAFGDSTIVYDSPNPVMRAIKDSRRPTKGVWLWANEKPLKKLLDDPVDVRWSPDGKSLLYKMAGAIWTLSPVTGKSQLYPWKNDEVLSFDDVSPDGKHTLFVKRRMNAKLILIDNVH